MKKKTYSELTALSIEDLRKKYASSLRELSYLRIKVRTGQEKNSALVPNLRKYVAQIQTALRQKEILVV